MLTLWGYYYCGYLLLAYCKDREAIVKLSVYVWWPGVSRHSSVYGGLKFQDTVQCMVAWSFKRRFSVWWPVVSRHGSVYGGLEFLDTVQCIVVA